MSKPHQLVFIMLCMNLAYTAVAGELRLNNGAVLPGELSSITAKTLVWKADKIGDVTVSKTDVLSLHTSNRVPVELARHEPALTGCVIGVENSLWSIDCEKQVPQPVAFAQLHTVPPATSSNGKISTSLDIERGANPSETINLDLTARWLRPTHRHKVDLSVDYETSDGDTTEDEADANYQYDLLRAAGWYWYGRIRYYRDEFEALKQVYAAGPGIGRDFNPIEELTLSLQGGPVEMYYQFDEQGWATEPGANAHWALTWQTPWHGIQASHSGDLGWVFSIEEGYLIQTKTGLTFPLYGGLIGEIRVDYDLTGLSAIDGSKYDLEWILGVGYKW